MKIVIRLAPHHQMTLGRQVKEKLDEDYVVTVCYRSSNFTLNSPLLFVIDLVISNLILPSSPLTTFTIQGFLSKLRIPLDKVVLLFYAWWFHCFVTMF